MAGIELCGLYKSYQVEGRPVDVLKGVDLHIPQGRITVVLGRSGCGKTTLLRLVGGLETPEGGEIAFDSPRKTAFVFQEPRLMPWLSVWDNITFGLKKEEIDPLEIADIVATVGLTGFERARPRQLSGGMQQRASIARSLAYRPSFIMMDEPFAALDYFTREQMQKELLRVQESRSTSILFVTHSIDEALLLGHKIVVIEQGVVKAQFDVSAATGSRNLLDPQFIALKRNILQQLELP